MSEENVEIIKRMLDEVQERPEALYEILDEQIEWETAALDMPFATGGRGPETVRQFFRSWVGAFEDWGLCARRTIPRRTKPLTPPGCRRRAHTTAGTTILVD